MWTGGFRNFQPVLGIVLCGLSAGTVSAADLPEEQKKDEKNEFVYVNNVGDVLTEKTHNFGAIHVLGHVGVDTADYFRGKFDDVPEDLDHVSGRLGVTVAIELLHNPGAILEGISLAGGSANGFSDTPVATEGEWYESNNFVGLGARFTGGWLAGVTYTAYDHPDIPGPVSEEIAGAVKYTAGNFIGRLSPQFKVAAPVNDGDGWFVQLKLKPSFDVAQIAAGPVTLAFPLAAGGGFDDYYGPGIDAAAYGQAGAELSVPLNVPNAYGRWSFSAGVDLVVREDEIVKAGGPFDDADNTVVIGRVELSFVY